MTRRDRTKPEGFFNSRFQSNFSHTKPSQNSCGARSSYAMSKRISVLSQSVRVHFDVTFNDDKVLVLLESAFETVSSALKS